MFSSFDFFPEQCKKNIRKIAEISEKIDEKRGHAIALVQKLQKMREVGSKFAPWRIFCSILGRLLVSLGPFRRAEIDSWGLPRHSGNLGI